MRSTFLSRLRFVHLLLLLLACLPLMGFECPANGIITGNSLTTADNLDLGTPRFGKVTFSYTSTGVGVQSVSVTGHLLITLESGQKDVSLEGSGMTGADGTLSEFTITGSFEDPAGTSHSVSVQKVGTVPGDLLFVTIDESTYGGYAFTHG